MCGLDPMGNVIYIYIYIVPHFGSNSHGDMGEPCIKMGIQLIKPTLWEAVDGGWVSGCR